MLKNSSIFFVKSLPEGDRVKTQKGNSLKVSYRDPSPRTGRYIGVRSYNGQNFRIPGDEDHLNVVGEVYDYEPPWASQTTSEKVKRLCTYQTRPGKPS